MSWTLPNFKNVVELVRLPFSQTKVVGLYPKCLKMFDQSNMPYGVAEVLPPNNTICAMFYPQCLNVSRDPPTYT